MTLDVRLAGRPDLDEVMALRYVVFVVGQGVPPELEPDELDEVSCHAVARLDEDVVGTGRLVPPQAEGAPAVIGRMAVAEDVRGKRVGAALLDLLEQTARRKGYREIELHAQLHARGFYDRAGYVAHGETFMEAGIEHVAMRKSL